MRPGALGAAFRMDPEYLVDVMASRGEVDMRNRTLELTRRSRALKLWLSLRTYGMEAIGAAVARGIELAEIAEALIRERRTVLAGDARAARDRHLRPRPASDEAAHRRGRPHAAAAEDGYAAVTATTLKDRSVLRLCTINPQTTEADLRGTLERLAETVSPARAAPDPGACQDHDGAPRSADFRPNVPAPWRVHATRRATVRQPLSAAPLAGAGDGGTRPDGAALSRS